MGRYRLEFDPPGYSFATEPGFDWQIDGAQMADRTDGSGKLFLNVTDHFAHLSSSRWLFCRPKQFDLDWWRNPDFPNYTARANKWMFCSGVSGHVSEILMTKLPFATGADGPDNFFASFVVPANLGTQPIAVNFGALQAAAGITLPTGLGVVASTAHQQTGNQTPYLAYALQPEPMDVICLGFGDFCLILTGSKTALLQTPANDHQGWKLIKEWSTGSDLGIKDSGFGARFAMGGMFSAYVTLRSLMIIPIGFDEIGIVSHGNSYLARVQNTAGQRNPSTSSQIKTGPWWIAGFPNQKFLVQTQAVGYREALHANLNDPTDLSATMFDMGAQNYKPTLAPKVWTGHVILTSGGSDLVRTELAAGYNLTSSAYRQQVEIEVIDENNAPWVSDGTRAKGALHIKLTPGNDPFPTGSSFGTTACSSPQLQLIQLQFPVKTTPRVTVPVNLDDTQFATVKIETSLREPGGKRLEIGLNSKGFTAAANAGLFGRHDFPVHLTEDVAGNGTYSALRAAGWIEGMEHEEQAWKGGDSTRPIRIYRIHARGIFAMAEDAPWLYMALTVDPANLGRLKHSTAVSRAFQQAGIDITDPAFYSAEADTRPDDVQQLPGIPDDDPGISGYRPDLPYAPTWGEGMGSYAARIASSWAGWLLFEKMGHLIRYQHDPINDVLDLGQDLAAAAILYNTRADAAAATPPGQQYLAEAHEIHVPLQSNFIRVIGKGEDNQPLYHVIDRDSASVTDRTAWNFVGAYVRAAVLSPKLAISQRASQHIARLAKKRLRVRRSQRKITVLQAPWYITRVDGGFGVDAGDVLALRRTLQADDKRLINHVETELLGAGRGSHAIWRTTFTAESLPPRAAIPGA